LALFYTFQKTDKEEDILVPDSDPKPNHFDTIAIIPKFCEQQLPD